MPLLESIACAPCLGRIRNNACRLGLLTIYAQDNNRPSSEVGLVAYWQSKSQSLKFIANHSDVSLT